MGPHPLRTDSVSKRVFISKAFRAEMLHKGICTKRKTIQCQSTSKPL